MIPKIIHYCWLSENAIPTDLQEYVDGWKKKLPDYEFVLWNFNKFEKNSSLWVQQAFDNKKYAFACDYIRLFAIYNYGGIYMDMDIEVLKNFDDLLDKNLMMAYEDYTCKGIEAGCFGAEKNNPLIKKCLDYYEGRSFVKADGAFDMIPLPKIMMMQLDEYDKSDFYSCDYFTAKSYETGELFNNTNTYAIHHFAGSWTSKAQQKYEARRTKYIKKFGRKKSYIFLLVPFLVWQLEDNGFWGVLKKCIFKLRKEK